MASRRVQYNGRRAEPEDCRARVAEAAPTPAELRRKFDFFWWTYSLQLSGTERVELAGIADTERARRARDAVYRAEVEARIGAALERSLAGFRAQVAEACTAVLGHIVSGSEQGRHLDARGRLARGVVEERNEDGGVDAPVARLLEEAVLHLEVADDRLGELPQQDLALAQRAPGPPPRVAGLSLRERHTPIVSPLFFTGAARVGASKYFTAARRRG